MGSSRAGEDTCDRYIATLNVRQSKDCISSAVAPLPGVRTKLVLISTGRLHFSAASDLPKASSSSSEYGLSSAHELFLEAMTKTANTKA